MQLYNIDAVVQPYGRYWRKEKRSVLMKRGSLCLPASASAKAQRAKRTKGQSAG